MAVFLPSYGITAPQIPGNRATGGNRIYLSLDIKWRALIGNACVCVQDNLDYVITSYSILGIDLIRQGIPWPGKTIQVITGRHRSSQIIPT